MLVAVDRDIDLPFGSTDLSGVALHHCRSRLDPILNRCHRLYHRCLLLLRFPLILDTRQNGITRTITVVGDTFAARLVGQAIEFLHLLNGVAVGCIDRFANTGVGIALDRCLHAYVLVRCQVVGGNEIVWRWFFGVLIPPCL